MIEEMWAEAFTAGIETTYPTIYLEIIRNPLCQDNQQFSRGLNRYLSNIKQEYY
jgi:hypothetical protein